MCSAHLSFLPFIPQLSVSYLFRDDLTRSIELSGGSGSVEDVGEKSVGHNLRSHIVTHSILQQALPNNIR